VADFQTIHKAVSRNTYAGLAALWENIVKSYWNMTFRELADCAGDSIRRSNPGLSAGSHDSAAGMGFY